MGCEGGHNIDPCTYILGLLNSLGGGEPRLDVIGSVLVQWGAFETFIGKLV